MKKTVLIVDKDKDILNLYKKMIYWDEYGYEILATVDNEKNAISSYGEYLYDLVITDIDLREGNGLSFLSRIKKMYPSSRFVVISEKSDYETVRMAMKLGAYDYFVKSKLRFANFIDLLNELNEADYLIAYSDISIESDLQKLMGLIRDKQKIDEKRVLKAIDIDKLPILNSTYRMFLFRLDHVYNLFHTKIFGQDKDVLHNDISYELEKAFKNIPNAKILFSKKHSGIVLVPPYQLETYIEIAKSLLMNLESGTGFTFCITISDAVSGVSSFYSQYIKTLHYHNWKFYHGDSTVCVMEHVPDFNDVNRELIQNQIDFLTKVSVRDIHEILTCKDQLLHNFEIQHTDPEQIISLFMMILTLIEEKEAQHYKSGTCDFDSMRLVISKCETLKQLSNELDTIFNTIANWIFDKTSRKYKKNVNKIILFVEQHINEKITLEMIAKHLGISEIHVSRIFKAETGKNLIQYINEQKIQRAIELMEHSNMKIKDVAEAVGFEDQLYFNKVFKKIIGISPSKYRSKAVD